MSALFLSTRASYQENKNLWKTCLKALNQRNIGSLCIHSSPTNLVDTGLAPRPKLLGLSGNNTKPWTPDAGYLWEWNSRMKCTIGTFQQCRAHLNGSSGLPLHLYHSCCISEGVGVESHKSCFSWPACAAVPWCVWAIEITLLLACSLIIAWYFSKKCWKRCEKCWWARVCAGRQNTGLHPPCVPRMKWQIGSFNKLQMPQRL